MQRTIEIKKSDKYNINVIYHRGVDVLPSDINFEEELNLKAGNKYRINITEGTRDDGYCFARTPYRTYFMFKYDGDKTIFRHYIDEHHCVGSFDCSLFEKLFFVPVLYDKYYKITVKKL